jgi:hypothetical protein
MAATITNVTVSAEFGKFTSFRRSSEAISHSIFLPKYYDPSLENELNRLSTACDLRRMSKLRSEKSLDYYTGDEIGKMAYGTGDIPFIRTSDFINWEIKHDPKMGISQEIYDEYAESEDVQPEDVFLVRDGTYLVGSSCIITEADAKCLFSGGLYKIRVLKNDLLDPYLLLGLLNAFIVKRQMRSKQFTRDVIDTLGKRIDEVYLPIPKDKAVREEISNAIRGIVTSRIKSRIDIAALARELLSV